MHTSDLDLAALAAFPALAAQSAAPRRPGLRTWTGVSVERPCRTSFLSVHGSLARRWNGQPFLDGRRGVEETPRQGATPPHGGCAGCA
jgi:hypothetical protein